MDKAELHRGFDPVEGCQGLSTGILGGLFILLLVGAYVDSSMTVAEPLAVSDAFPWLPAAVAMPSVSREPLVLLGILAMGAFFMASWELLDHRGRPVILVGALLAVGLAWQGTLGSQPLPPSAEGFWVHLCGLRWTRLEAGLIYGAALLVAIAGFFAVSRLRSAPHDRRDVARALRTSAWRWLAGLGLFLAVMAMTFTLPFYGTPAYESYRLSFLVFFSIYLFLGLPYAFVTNLALPAPGKELQDPGFVIMLVCRAGWRSLRQGKLQPLRVVLRHRDIRVMLRDVLLVKLFFVPVMTISFFLNASYFARSFVYHPTGVTESGLTYTYLPQNWYAFVFFGLGLAEVAVGMLGYLSSSRWLGNKSRSVDPTFGGWLVAVACYPPFNAGTTWLFSAPGHEGGLPLLDFRQVPWLTAGSTAALNEILDFSLASICMVAYFVYVLATLAFGLRFSNMTHRGILTRGPYAFVRHPAYICKMIVWWGQNVRGYTSVWQLASMLGWTAIYVLRALTEERHLRTFEDYQAYCKRVRYRFIPGII